MSTTVYKQTATKSKSGVVFAFGRNSYLDGKDKALGGYIVFELCANYNGSVRGGITHTWRAVGSNLSYFDAVTLLNRRVGSSAFQP